MCLISVIVPVYKVEDYLSRCIDSILSQTVKDFELLLINDGSPDNCGNICNEYAAKDSRIRVFHKENGGVSSARNLGLDNAKGKWVAFIDADDWISNDFFEIPEKYATVDVIQKNSIAVFESGNKFESGNINRDYLYSKPNDIDKFYTQNRKNALWDKLISRHIIGEHRFDIRIKMGEDFLFFLQVYSNIKQYAFSPVGYYYYLKRNGSASRNWSSEEQFIDAHIEVVNNIKTISTNHSISYSMMHALTSHYVIMLFKVYNISTENQKLYYRALLRNMTRKNLVNISNILYFKILIVKIIMSSTILRNMYFRIKGGSLDIYRLNNE